MAKRGNAGTPRGAVCSAVFQWGDRLTMAEPDLKQALIYGACVGVVLFVLAAVVLVVSGSTAGQRCTAAGLEGDEWVVCVREERDGGPGPW